MGFLMPPNPLTNFEMQKYSKNEPRFNGVFSRNNLPEKIKDGAYIINLDDMQMLAHIGMLYFVTGIKLYISIVLVLNIFLKKLKSFVGNKNIRVNIFRVQPNDSVRCWDFWIGFIDFMLPGEKID